MPDKQIFREIAIQRDYQINRLLDIQKKFLYRKIARQTDTRQTDYQYQADRLPDILIGKQTDCQIYRLIDRYTDIVLGK